MNLVVTVLLVCLASFHLSCEPVQGVLNKYDVRKYGAVGDARADDSQAFLKAWRDVCGDTGSRGTPTMFVEPSGKFLLKPLLFLGPCKSKNINVEIQGTIVAPNSISAFGGCDKVEKWLSFSKIDGLIINGSGFIDGQGEPWYKLGKNTKCGKPTLLSFNKCDNLRISDVHTMNPPQNHYSINTCKDVVISNIDIKAPSNSPNTDGIDISASSQVTIRDSIIGTGDDCIAINSGTAHVNITIIQCGPGHGISLGKNRTIGTVEDVRLIGSTFTRTQNGARIKTWPEGQGFARKITFDDITLVEVEHPIMIDQKYCNGRLCESDKPSMVKISDVTFKSFRGTSAAKTKEAISLICSDAMGFGCSNVVMDHVNIASVVPGRVVTATCKNVAGRSTSSAPQVSCLQNKATAPQVSL